MSGTLGASLVLYFGWSAGAGMSAAQVAESRQSLAPRPTWSAEILELANDGRLELALERLQLLHSKEPQSAELMRWIGEIQESRGDLESAIDWFRQSLERDAASLEALKLALRVKNLERRMRSGEQERTESPERRRAREATHRAHVALRELGDADAARRLFEEAIASDPSYAPAQYNLARMLEVDGLFEQSLEHYRAFSSLESASAFRVRAESAIRRLEPLAARIDQDAVREEWLDARAIAEVLTLLEAGEPERALRVAEARRSTRPTTVELHTLCASILCELSRGEEASRAIDAALQHCAPSERAALEAQRALLNDRVADVAGTRLALEHEQQGNHAAAAVELDKLLARDSSDDELALATAEQWKRADRPDLALDRARRAADAPSMAVRENAKQLVRELEAELGDRLGWHGELMPEGLVRGKIEGEYLWPRDGSRMVFVPGACATLGRQDGEPLERPSHEVDVAPFYLDMAEVSNGQFKAFATRTARALPPVPDWPVQTDQPVVNVTWDDAGAYAQSCGKRLPTEAEWERAARGTDARSFPWGDEWVQGRANFADRSCPIMLRWRADGEDDGYPTVAPVHAFASAGSPFGALQLAGNVREWCADWLVPYPDPARPGQGISSQSKERVCRGGGWQSPMRSLRTTHRAGCPPATRAVDLGFRCVLPGVPERIAPAQESNSK